KFQVENTNDGYHPRFVHESAFKARAHFTGRSPRQAASSQDSGCTVGFAEGHSVLEWPDVDDSVVTKVTPEVASDYVGRLERQHGAARAQRALIRRHVVIMPNVVLMDMNIRVIQPVAVDRTEVHSHFVALDDVPEAVNRVRLRDVQMRLGTAGMINTDDLEVFTACQTGVQAPGMDW